VERIIPVVAACIRKRHPLRILLHLKGETRNPTSRLLVDKWELPGGVMKYGETPEQALEREIREELGGIIIQVNRLIHAQTNIYADGKHYLVLYYECQTSYEATPDGCRWFDPKDIDPADCLPGTCEAVRELNRFTLGVY